MWMGRVGARSIAFLPECLYGAEYVDGGTCSDGGSISKVGGGAQNQ